MTEHAATIAVGVAAGLAVNAVMEWVRRGLKHSDDEAARNVSIARELAVLTTQVAVLGKNVEILSALVAELPCRKAGICLLPRSPQPERKGDAA